MSDVQVQVNGVSYVVYFDEDTHEIHFVSDETGQLMAAYETDTNSVALWEGEARDWRRERHATPDEARPFRAAVPEFWAAYAANQLKAAIAAAERAIPEAWRAEWENIDWPAATAPVTLLERIVAAEKESAKA